MDLVVEVERRFGQAAAKAGRRLSHQSKRQSTERHGERQDPSERLMSKIVHASRPSFLQKPVTKPAPKAKPKTDEPVIVPVPKVSSNG